MKKIHVMLFTAVVALCANAFAVTVGDTVAYERNSSRTSKIIREAKGAATVVDVPQGMTCEGGTVIRLDYELNVLIVGKQKGSMGVCVPNAILGSTFYADLKSGMESFGAFDLEHKGMATASDAGGKKYQNCDVVHVMNVNHKHEPKNVDEAKVMWIDHSGSITSVSDVSITFKAAPGVKVLGAVEIDFKGVSNRGNAFTVGLDMK